MLKSVIWFFNGHLLRFLDTREWFSLLHIKYPEMRTFCICFFTLSFFLAVTTVNMLVGQ